MINLWRVRMIAFAFLVVAGWAGQTMPIRAGEDPCGEFCGYTCEAGECWAEVPSQCEQFQGCTYADDSCDLNGIKKAVCDCLACG